MAEACDILANHKMLNVSTNTKLPAIFRRAGIGLLNHFVRNCNKMAAYIIILTPVKISYFI